MRQIPFSVLDLSPVLEGETPREALQHTVDLARHVEALGFHRFWVAEHHNMPGVASAATAVVVGHVAGATRTIRVGSGGIMLLNHVPLIVAEQFGTLESLYPGRIDLGLGRASGGDGAALRALRALRRGPESADRFREDLQQLRFFFQDVEPEQPIRAVPGAGLTIPIWLLGSSTYSAKLAATSGLPFAFGAHFSPEAFGPALAVYRSGFRPSAALHKPRVMICVTIVAADSDAEARRLFTSQQQAFIALRSNKPGLLQPPLCDITAIGTPAERASVDHTLRNSIVGAPRTIWTALKELLAETQADELMVASQIFDQAAGRRSFEIIARMQERGTEPKLSSSPLGLRFG